MELRSRDRKSLCHLEHKVLRARSKIILIDFYFFNLRMCHIKAIGGERDGERGRGKDREKEGQIGERNRDRLGRRETG